MSNEDEYFAKVASEKKQRMKIQLEAELSNEARAERKKLHWNCCGKCGCDMATKVFRGVEIEICPSCGAVLLDPGELETLAGQDHSGAINAIFSTFVRGRH